MTSRLEDAFTAPKTYCNLINHLLYKKKIPAIPSLLADGNFDSDFNKKANFLIITLDQYVHLKKMQLLCHIFPIEQTGE